MQDYPDKTFIYFDDSRWAYYSLKAMRKKYPEGGYKLMGEVTKKKGKKEENPIEKDKDAVLYVQPLKTYKKPCYRRIGFIYSEDKGSYVLVKKSNFLFILLGILLSMLLIGGIVWVFMNQSVQPKLDPNASAFDAKLERPASWDDSKILVPGYDTLKMSAGSDMVYVALFNPKENPCYFQFKLIMDETGEELFSTGLVPPGSAVTSVKLPSKLEAGIYDITIKISSFSLSDATQNLNGGEVKTKIIAVKE